MRTTTILIALTMLTTGLAGCTGDPDGGGNDEFDAETLQGMIESGLEDFMNNTTVEITTNYYTNETSTTTNNINGSGGVSDSSLHVLAGVETGESVLGIGIDSDDSLSLLVRADAYPGNGGVGNLNGANICVGIGTWAEGQLVDYFSAHDISFTSVPVAGNAEATAKFIDGSCDAITGQTFALQGLKEALDLNGSMGGVDIWIGGPVGVVSSEYHDYSWLSGYNYLNLTISQSSGEASYLSYAYAEITLTGTCISNCTGQNDTITQTITFDLDGGGPMSIIFETGPPIETVSSCEYEFEEEDWGGYFGPYGLECDLTLSMRAEIDLTSSWHPFNIENFSDYEFSWGDWTYYLLWTTSTVTMHE